MPSPKRCKKALCRVFIIRFEHEIFPSLPLGLFFPKAILYRFFEFTKFLWRPRTKQKFDLSVHFCIPFFLSPCHKNIHHSQGLVEMDVIPAIIEDAMSIPCLQRLSIKVRFFVLFHFPPLTYTFRRRVVHIPKSSRIQALSIQCSRTTLLWRN